MDMVGGIRSENYRFWAKFFAIEVMRCYKLRCFLSISILNFGFFREKLTLWLGLAGNHDFIAKNQLVVGSESMIGGLHPPKYELTNAAATIKHVLTEGLFLPLSFKIISNCNISRKCDCTSTNPCNYSHC